MTKKKKKGELNEKKTDDISKQIEKIILKKEVENKALKKIIDKLNEKSKAAQ